MNYVEIYRQNKLLKPDRERSSNTIATYIPILDHLDEWLAENHSLSIRDESIHEVKATMLEDYDRELAARNYAISTRNLKLKVIKQFFSYLHDAEYLDRNVAKVLELIPITVDEEAAELTQRGFTVEEVVRIMDSANGCNARRDRALIALLVGSALRISEACSLNIEQILEYPKKKCIFVTIKGNRRVKARIAAWAFPYIEDYIKYCRKHAFPSDPLFVSTQRNRLTRITAGKSVAAIEKRLGLKTGVHNFRHTAITEIKRSAGDITVAQAVANHKSSKTTEGYDHTEEDLQQALNSNALGAALGRLAESSTV